MMFFKVTWVYLFLEKELIMQIKGKEYHGNMNPEGRFHLYISGKNLETGRLQSKDMSFMLKKPELLIQVIL
jgi:hypothetical protein